MTLNDLQRQGRLRPHRTSRREISDLLRLTERELLDAGVPGVSADRRFMIAYEAAVALATIPLNAAGFRTEGAGHHQTTFLALPLVMAPSSPSSLTTSTHAVRSATPGRTTAAARPPSRK
jgi:hypothetical protein